MKSREQLAVDKIELERSSQHTLEDSSVGESENVEYQHYYQHAKDRKAQEQGWIGKVLGDRGHAPIYIICIILLLVAGTFCYLAINAVEYRQEIFELLKFFILTGIGFLAGSRYSSRSE